MGFIVALALAGLAAALLLLAVACAALVAALSAPSFDEAGQINECVGCRGHERDGWRRCRCCRYNPRYWDGYTYKGPPRRALKRIRKEMDRE